MPKARSQSKSSKLLKGFDTFTVTDELDLRKSSQSRRKGQLLDEIVVLRKERNSKHESFIKLSQENGESTQLLELKEQLIKLHDRFLQKFEEIRRIDPDLGCCRIDPETIRNKKLQFETEVNSVYLEYEIRELKNRAHAMSEQQPHQSTTPPPKLTDRQGLTVDFAEKSANVETKEEQKSTQNKTDGLMTSHSKHSEIRGAVGGKEIDRESNSSSKQQALQRRREIQSKIKRSEFDLTASQKDIDDQIRELQSKKDRLQMDHERNLFDLNEELEFSDGSVCDDKYRDKSPFSWRSQNKDVDSWVSDSKAK